MNVLVFLIFFDFFVVFDYVNLSFFGEIRVSEKLPMIAASDT